LGRQEYKVSLDSPCNKKKDIKHNGPANTDRDQRAHLRIKIDKGRIYDRQQIEQDYGEKEKDSKKPSKKKK
jgi:hypothetical protein